MTLLQRISRSVLTCGILPSRWIRPGRRKYMKVVSVAAITFLILSIIARRSDRHTYNTNIAAPLEARRFVDEVNRQAVPKNVEYDVKEEAASRHLMGLKNCSEQPSELIGGIRINPNITPSFDEVKKMAGRELMKGGCFFPADCKPLQKVAVIIPFKDRDAHLKTLLYYLHPILKRQKIHYCIYVAEQFDNGQFNKAMVMNAAFEEAMKIDTYDCIVFHDVDMIPENDKNMYTCGSEPRHLSPAIDKFQYKPHYGTDFGGVTGISPAQYRKANGHSNQFWGWGGEDNDMEFRIFYNKMKIVPSDLKIGRYKMIVHKHPWKFSPNEFPFRLNRTREARAKTDGLSDLKYRMVETVRHLTYTKFIIDIRRIEVKRVTLFMDGRPTMDIDIKPGPCRWERYDGKYLDYNIELSELKEAAHLTALHIGKTKTQAPIPDHVQKTMGSTPPAPKVRFSLVDNFTEALDLCEKIHPECQGVQKENSEEKYSLRRSNIPRNIVVTAPARPAARLKNQPPPDPKAKVEKKYYFPRKVPFVKYCPGPFGNYQWVKSPLKIGTQLPPKHNHTYSFAVHFAVLLSPSKYIHYRDSKHFEAQLNKGESFYTFHWPGDQPPNFADPQTPREYVLKTVQFNVPNIPGCYAIESKIQDRYQQPYFQWNWWFEVTTGDRELDAVTREVYWRTQMNENAKETAKLSDQRKQEAEQAKREREFQKQMAAIHQNDLKIQERHLRGEIRHSQGESNEENKDKYPMKGNVREDIEPYDAEEAPPKESLPIEVYDPAKTIAPVLQPVVNPPVTIRPVHKQFHAALPKHLRDQATS